MRCRCAESASDHARWTVCVVHKLGSDLQPFHSTRCRYDRLGMICSCKQQVHSQHMNSFLFEDCLASLPILAPTKREILVCASTACNQVAQAFEFWCCIFWCFSAGTVWVCLGLILFGVGLRPRHDCTLWCRPLLCGICQAGSTAGSDQAFAHEFHCCRTAIMPEQPSRAALLSSCQFQYQLNEPCQCT